MKFSLENIDRITNDLRYGLTFDEVTKLYMGEYSLEKNEKDGLTIIFH